MYFWRWARSVNQKGDPVAQRAHGLQLQPRWNGTGEPPVHQSPPFAGAPALETTHPFHFKMSPGVLLGPKCNHGLGVLLRLAQDLCAQTSGGVSRAKALASRLEPMGDHEYYRASYSI